MKTKPPQRKRAPGAPSYFAGMGILPSAKKAALDEIIPLMETLLRDTNAVDAGNLMAHVFESAVATRPLPKASLAVALVRGRVAREQLKAEEGGGISADEARMKLGLSKEAVLKRFRKGQLLGWREAKQDAVRLPVWQFTDDNVLPGIPEVLAILNQASWMDDWGRILFFLNQRSSLGGRRPLDLLRKGKIRQVLDAAHSAIE